MKNIFLPIMLLSLLLCFNNISAQTFNITYGNVMALTYPHGIIKTSDGGYLFFSDYLPYPSEHNTLIIKTTASGDTLWTRHLIDPGLINATIVSSALELPNAQGYLLTGYYLDVISGTGVSNGLLFRLDANGNLLWTNEYANNLVGHDFNFKSSCLSSDGNLLILGIAATVANPLKPADVLIKISMTGNILWAKSIFNFEGFDANPQFVRELPDQSIIIVGDTIFPLVGQDAVLMKLDSNGSLLWAKSYSSTLLDCVPSSLALDGNGSFLISGSRISATAAIGFIMSLDSSGNVAWYKEYGNWSVDNQGVRKICILDNGDIAALSGTMDTIILFLTDAVGNIQWTRGFHFSSPAGNSVGTDFVVADDGGFAIVGSHYGYGHLFKTDASGNTECDTVSVNFSSQNGTIFSNPKNSPETNVLFPVTVPVYLQDQGIGVNVVCFSTGIAQDGMPELETVFYPNPVQNELTISLTSGTFVTNGNMQKPILKVYDALGQLIYSQNLLNPNTILPTSDWKKGIYLIRLTIDGKETSNKIIKE